MKYFGTVLFAAMAFFFTACQPIVDVEAEKQAIIDVINAETDAYLDFDFDKVISFYVQDSLNFRLTTGADDHVFLEGWDEVEAFFRQDILEGNPDALPNTHINVEKDNYRIKLYSESAFVLCTETWTYTTDDNVIEINSRQVRFMEKVEGEWKIAFLSFIGTSGYEEEEELEELGAEFNSI
jgi:ketosteroid isomerase-like protein